MGLRTGIVIVFLAFLSPPLFAGDNTSALQPLIDKIKELTHSLDKMSKDISNDLDKTSDVEEPPDDEPAAKAPRRRETVKPVDPAEVEKRKATLEKLKKFMEDLGIDVMKQVNQAVDRLNKMSREIDP